MVGVTKPREIGPDVPPLPSGIEDDDVGRAETDVCGGCGDAVGLSDDAVTGGLDEEP